MTLEQAIRVSESPKSFSVEEQKDAWYRIMDERANLSIHNMAYDAELSRLEGREDFNELTTSNGWDGR